LEVLEPAGFIFKISEVFSMSTERHTGKDVASVASDVLQDGRYSDEAKTLAASTLSQAAHENRKTSDEVARLAGDMLKNLSYGDETQTLAASVLSQRAPQ
jgi:hypothetical protein